MLLELRHLKKHYATQKAVDDISFSVQKGGIFGLLGPNGAGKTTLIRMITGIILPDEGSVIFDGRPFDPAKDIAQIGYMPEERGLYKKMKIGEQAVYLARLRGLGRDEAYRLTREWFTRLEMQSWWNKKVEDLSKGMSQKLQFVTTVLHRPRLIILDEPFSGLDPVNANVIKEEIFRLAQEGSTIIFSTHRMEQVEEICDHIVLVNKGQKILDGSVREVKQYYKEHLYRVGFERMPAVLEGPGFAVVGADTKSPTLTVRIDDGFTPNAVLQFFISQGAELRSFNEQLPTLNEIFIRLVEGTSPARSFQTFTV
ncbi:ATP-binding cassette domain-containing protein [Flaviaesturariibacter amylovorans]|uniref:ABC transporter ATP-binding protein n=1 Tax=Flaviaesturariibacter amylovorans TaxID=1084520 RepID=A0ABP8HS10_9BACT